VVQVAYELRDIFRNFTGSSACFGSPPAGSTAPDECAVLIGFPSVCVCFRPKTPSPSCHPCYALVRIGRRLAILLRCDASSKFGLLPYPALSSNTSQRLTTIKFFLNALGGDVSGVCSTCSRV
jgi:hypothetical protein